MNDLPEIEQNMEQQNTIDVLPLCRADIFIKSDVGTVEQREDLKKQILHAKENNIEVMGGGNKGCWRSTAKYKMDWLYEELRNLAMELKIPIWTASQANKDSSKSDIVGLENLGESYGKAQVADVVLSISRKPMEKSTGGGRIFVAKNRAGRDGLLFPISIDTARSKFQILDDTELTLNEAVSQDNHSMKEKLREKWKEVNGD